LKTGDTFQILISSKAPLTHMTPLEARGVQFFYKHQIPSGPGLLRFE